MTTEGDSAADPLRALRVIERAIWREGVMGDACARVAAAVVEALAADGFVLVRE